MSIEHTDGPQREPAVRADPSVRSDQQKLRPARVVRSDASAEHRRTAGEYGEGRAQQASGVGPRNPEAGSQTLNDEPGYPDTYGNVEPGRYGVHGYSSPPAHPSSYALETHEAHADQRLRELICERLTEDPDIDASDVTVEVNAGEVRLSGRVDSPRTREIIELVVENCGAKRIRNDLVTAARA